MRTYRPISCTPSSLQGQSPWQGAHRWRFSVCTLDQTCISRARVGRRLYHCEQRWSAGNSAAAGESVLRCLCSRASRTQGAARHLASFKPCPGHMHRHQKLLHGLYHVRGSSHGSRHPPVRGGIAGDEVLRVEGLGEGRGRPTHGRNGCTGHAGLEVQQPQVSPGPQRSHASTGVLP